MAKKKSSVSIESLAKLLDAITKNNLEDTAKYVDEVNTYCRSKDIPNLQELFTPGPTKDLNASFEYAVINLEKITEKEEKVWLIKYYISQKSNFTSESVEELYNCSLFNNAYKDFMSDVLIARLINACYYAKRFDLLKAIKEKN